MALKTQYLHGGNYISDFERLGIAAKKIIDFSVNVNPLGPPAILEEKWISLFNEVKKYPSQDGCGVKNYYKEKFAINKENVLPGNGSAELIYFVMQNLSLKNIIILTPSFNDYSRAANINKVKIIDAALSVNSNFSIPSVDSLNKKLNNSDAIFIGHPNNPTGTMYSRDEILFLAKKNPEKWILLDEAFIQFVENYLEQSFLSVKIPNNIIVFHSLTKYYTLPGLRLGAIIAKKSLITQLENEKPLWSINRPAEILVRYLNDNTDFEKRTEQLIFNERKRIFKELSLLEGINIFPTYSNFFLAQWNATNNLDDLQKEFLNNAMYVRDARNFDNLSNNYFRFAILKKNENSKLIAKIKNCIMSYND